MNRQPPAGESGREKKEERSGDDWLKDLNPDQKADAGGTSERIYFLTMESMV